MASSKLDFILNNIRTTLSDVDTRKESEWDLPTLEHAKARFQWLAADALQAMNLIDESRSPLKTIQSVVDVRCPGSRLQTMKSP